LAVTSIVKGRGGVIGVVAMLTTAVALASVPAALGAVDGDPIASQTFSFKLGKKFKKQLKKNHVKMKPKALKLTSGDIDPTNGTGDLKFANVTFKKGKNKIQFKSLKGSMPGKIKSTNGALFKLTAPTATRNGFGADLTGTKVKFLKSAAKKINKALKLHSLKPTTAGSFNLSYQPKTVKVVSGTASVTGSLTGPTATTVVDKLVFHHCALPGPIAPATQNGLTISFPVTGGTIGPSGTAGVVQQAGGVRIAGTNPPTGSQNNCNNQPSSLTQSDFAPNLELQNIQAHVVLEKGPPGVATGDRGIAITQTTDPAGATVSANASNHTISVNGATVKINQVSADSLNLFFPQASGGSPTFDFAGGDTFGKSNLTVTTR
jgi:hypothetical protein